MRGGLSEDEALRTLTSNPAQMMHLEDRVGSLEKGKDADFVVLSGPPFSIYTQVLETYIEGERLFDRGKSRDWSYQAGGFALADSDRLPKTPELVKPLSAVPAPAVPKGAPEMNGSPSRIAVFHGLEAGLGGKVAVFDEVDAGIGGRVAYVLAKKLRRLARGRQVLCVTHLAPVAAAAARHLGVRKRERKGRTEVEVLALEPAQRIEELSRMIGGDQPSEAVRRHSQELLALAAGGDGSHDNDVDPR